MGNILGDIFFGGQSRTDRKQITDLYPTLGNLASSATGAGQSEEGDAASYFKSLLSGNPTAQAAAIAPQENAVAGQNEAEKQRLSSEGTARGGGVNAAQEGTQDAATKTAVDSLTALQPTAAGHLGQIGATETGEGLQAGQQLGTLAEAERRTNLAHQAAEGSDVGKGLEAISGLLPAAAPTTPAFPGQTVGDIMGSYGGPTSVPTIDAPLPTGIDVPAGYEDLLAPLQSLQPQV